MADADARPEGEENPPKGGKKKLIIIIAAAVLVLLAGGGAAFFFLMGGDDASDPSAPAAVAQKEAIYVKIRTLEGRPMFVASLENPNGNRHFMQVYAEAKTRHPESEQLLNQHMPLIVARLNTLFTTSNAPALRSVDGIRTLQQDATELVNRLLQDRGGEPGVEIVLFTNFVMQ